MNQDKLLGRICYKIAGREGSKLAIITDVLGNNFVEIDGQVKRRRCNLSHLELTSSQLPIKKGISTEEVRELLKSQQIIINHQKKPGVKKPLKEIKQKSPKRKALQENQSSVKAPHQKDNSRKKEHARK